VVGWLDMLQKHLVLMDLVEIRSKLQSFY